MTPIEIPVKFSLMDVISFNLALFPTFIYAKTKNWMASNFFGYIFCISAIDGLALPNFKVGFILLWGLFIYDIFWVFGTDVMVTVAKNIDAPIKILFPLDLLAEEPKFSLLGLGDIVIPAVFVALCLKFDVDRLIKKKSNSI